MYVPELLICICNFLNIYPGAVQYCFQSLQLFDLLQQQFLQTAGREIAVQLAAIGK
jgi:hypothetical protein